MMRAEADPGRREIAVQHVDPALSGRPPDHEAKVEETGHTLTALEAAGWPSPWPAG
jgi:hypothetical protein